MVDRVFTTVEVGKVLGRTRDWVWRWSRRLGPEFCWREGRRFKMTATAFEILRQLHEYLPRKGTTRKDRRLDRFQPCLDGRSTNF